MILGVSLAAGAAGLLVHPRNHADGALGTQMEPLQQLRRFHGNHYAGAVVDRARAQVPGVEMSGQHNDLLGMLTALKIGDHVMAGGFRQLLRGESKVHANLALRRQVRNERCVFRGDCARRNPRRNAEAGMGKSIVGIAHRSHQAGHPTPIGHCCRTGGPVAHRFAVCGEGHAGRRFLFVVELVEQHDLSGNPFAA